MKKFLFILFLVLQNIALFAQKTVSVTGQLFDTNTQETLPFANISVHDARTNKLITGAITDDDGRFQILEMPLGKYKLYFSYIGYETAQQNFGAGGLNSIFDLGRIELQTSATALQEVEVIRKTSDRGCRPEQEIL